MESGRPLPPIDFAHFELEETLRATEEFQEELAARGLVPDTRRLFLRRIGIVLQIVGALILGLFVAQVAVVLAFVVFNRILHVGT